MCMCVCVCIYVSAVSCVAVRGQPWICTFLFQLCELQHCVRPVNRPTSFRDPPASSSYLPAESLGFHRSTTAPNFTGFRFSHLHRQHLAHRAHYSFNLETQSPVAQAGLALATDWRMTLDSWPSRRHLPRVTVMSYYTQFATY